MSYSESELRGKLLRAIDQVPKIVDRHNIQDVYDVISIVSECDIALAKKVDEIERARAYSEFCDVAMVISDLLHDLNEIVASIRSSIVINPDDRIIINEKSDAFRFVELRKRARGQSVSAALLSEKFKDE